jgi:hypothetical protein
MKTYALLTLTFFLMAACGGTSGGGGASTDKPLTVDELRGIQKDKPDEFKTKYLGKKVTVVGKASDLPSDTPGAYTTFGYQIVRLQGTGDVRSIECQVTEAEGAKFKDVKAGDVVTVTGTVKAGESTMDLTGCSKATAAK